VIIVADASPLIAFARIDMLPILAKTLGSIIIPQSVANECIQDKSRAGAIGIQEAIQRKIITVGSDPNPMADPFIRLRTSLGQGESAAIAMALELRAALLVDEKLARSAAIQFNIKIIGTAGVLLLAKQKKLIPTVLPLIQQLKKAGYYLADSLISEVAKMAHEKI
jgi:predicted nucleic acid-binding protein